MLAVLTLNRHQSIMEIQAVNPRSGSSKTILREESDTYLNEQVYAGIEFYDKHFVLQSERSGYNQLYLYTIDGILVRPITKGEFEVKHFYGWDSNKNEFYYSSNEGSPLREYVYKVNAKGKKTKLTAKEGTYNDNDPIGVLDVTVLSDLVLDKILGISDLRTSKRIDFVGGIRGLGELARRVDSGEMKVAFALYPVSMRQLIDIADTGNIMPPKTTWFEPKLRSGVVIHTFE